MQIAARVSISAAQLESGRATLKVITNSLIGAHLSSALFMCRVWYWVRAKARYLPTTQSVPPLPPQYVKFTISCCEEASRLRTAGGRQPRPMGLPKGTAQDPHWWSCPSTRRFAQRFSSSLMLYKPPNLSAALVDGLSLCVEPPWLDDLLLGKLSNLFWTTPPPTDLHNEQVL